MALRLGFAVTSTIILLYVHWSFLNAGGERVVYANRQPGWNKRLPVTEADLEKLRQEALDMFDVAYKGYMLYAFPKDGLRPISCTGGNTQGGIGLTLLDVLDTFVTMGRQRDLQRAVELIRSHIHFNKPARVHVFEVTIRAIGGLLSGEVLIQRNPVLVPKYRGILLKKAVDLANRLLPAFDTPTGIPVSWVDLQKGVLPKDTRTTCTACATTLLLEFGLLSRMTGDQVYEHKAKAAVRAIFDRRSDLGLLGNTLNVDSGSWVRRDGGIGAGIDSTYEYLLKGYLLFGDEEYLAMFVELYSHAMHNMQTPGLVNGHKWLADVHMAAGHVTRPWISSLGAFWPGIQALAGQEADARALHANFTSVWSRFAALPELFSLDGTHRHPIEKTYPLRPELIESTCLLYGLTKDPQYLQIGRILHRAIASTRAGPCGHASVRDVLTGQLEDGMESFFLSETTKYLHLLHSNITEILDFFVFSTEGHMFPPLGPEGTRDWTAPGEVPQECWGLCEEQPEEAVSTAQSAVQRGFPLLSTQAADWELLRHRRCTACVAVSKGMAALPPRDPKEQAYIMNIQWQPGPGVPEWGRQEELSGTCSIDDERQAVSVLGYVECKFGFDTSRKLWRCREVNLLEDLEDETLNSLPATSVVLQLSRPHDLDVLGRLLIASGPEVSEFDTILAAFGPQLQDVGDCAVRALADIASSFEDEYVDEQDGMGLGLSQGFDSSCEDPDVAPGSCPWPTCDGRLVVAKLAVAEPLRACSPLENAQAVRGTVVVVERGSCSFMAKVAHAQAAGAVGVVVANHENTDEIITMGPDFDQAAAIIPAAMVSQASSAKILRLAKASKDSPLHAILAKSDSSLLPASPTHGGSRFHPEPTQDHRSQPKKLISDASNQCPKNPWAHPHRAKPAGTAGARGQESAGKARESTGKAQEGVEKAREGHGKVREGMGSAQVHMIVPGQTRAYLREVGPSGPDVVRLVQTMFSELLKDEKAVRMLMGIEGRGPQGP